MKRILVSCVLLSLSLALSSAETPAPAPAQTKAPVSIPESIIPAELYYDAKKKPQAYYELENKPMPAIDFSKLKLKDGQKAPVDLKGKIVVVDLFATWCGPCKRLLPHNDELQKKFGDKVVFLSICVSGDEAAWTKLVADRSSLMLFSPDKSAIRSSLCRDFKLPFYPFVSLIDGKGTLRSAGLNVEKAGNLEKALEILINEKP